MKLHALLAWYDEPVADLIRCIDSIAGAADYLIAIDGAYETFPHPEGNPISPTGQAHAIMQACMRHGIDCHIETPNTPWRNEGFKRTRLFELALEHGTPLEDWVLPIDADEEWIGTDALRSYVENAPAAHEVVGVYYDTPQHPSEDRELLLASTDVRSFTQSRLLRLMPGLHVEQPTHWQFAHDAGRITKPHHVLQPDVFKLLHHTTARPKDRMRLKRQHVDARNARGET